MKNENGNGRSEQLNTTQPAELIRLVDAARGDVERSTWVRRAVVERLARETTAGKRKLAELSARRRGRPRKNADAKTQAAKGK